MKKISFFTKFFMILTILSVSVFYILSRYYEELIVTPAKRLIIEFTAGDFIDEVKNIQNTPEKQILLDEINKFSDFVLNQNSINLDSIKTVAETIGKAIKDSTVSRQELEQILQQLNKYKNERHQKN